MKEEKKTKNITPKEREKYGKTGSVVAILCNVALAVGKIAAGVISGAISVLADGLNNLSDCGSGAVSLVSFRLAAKPADKEHPYGHQRVEYIASMAVAFIILVVAFELAKESVGKILSPEAAEFSVLALAVLAASVLVKGFMFFYARALGKKIDSDVLLALSKDSLSDCVATLVVIAGLLIWTHRKNIERLKNGTESKTYIWRPVRSEGKSRPQTAQDDKTEQDAANGDKTAPAKGPESAKTQKEA